MTTDIRNTPKWVMVVEDGTKDSICACRGLAFNFFGVEAAFRPVS